jgi:nicotinamidase-related amidase
MPLTQLDKHTALIVIDLQKGVMAMAASQGAAQVAAHARVLADAFRRQGLPVVCVRVAGFAPGRVEQPRIAALPDDWSELIPELGHAPDDIVVTKRTWGAFTGTDLATILRGKGVTQVVLAGISTSIGVESTARQAHELGLNVTLAVDAMTDLHPDAHAHSITRIFPRLGETGTTQEIVALLQGFSQP